MLDGSVCWPIPSGRHYTIEPTRYPPEHHGDPKTIMVTQLARRVGARWHFGPASADGGDDSDGQDSPAGVPDDQPAGIQSPFGSVVCPTSIR
jgi:hypothetical protein